MRISIIPWTQESIDAITQMEASLHQDPWPKEAFLTCFHAGYKGYVVSPEEAPDAKPIAYVLFSIIHDECHLLNIGVTKTWQRQGIGDLLLRYCEESASHHHASRIYLEVRESNHIAIYLYQKHGFEVIGKRKEYYRTQNGREDAVLLLKRLGLNNK